MSSMAESGAHSATGASGFASYPVCKDSGVEWLGEIPAHWEVRRLKRLCRLEYGESLAAGVRELGAVSVLGSNGRVGWHTSANTGAPCIVIGRKGSHGKVNYSRDAVFAIDTTFFVDRESTSVCLRWLFFALRQLRLDRVTKDAAVPGLDRAEAYERLLPLPPVSEQQAIAAFLDWETAKIDALVSKQRELMDRLQEKRAALISHAVTKGLDPDASMRDSGVEWLGDTPVHWPLQRLRTLASITTGSRDTIDRRHDGEYPFFVRSPVVERIDTWSFDGEAVLTAGDGVGVAKVFHYANEKFDFHQRVYKFSDFDGILGRFFFRYFGALLRFETLRGTAKSTVDSLRLPMLQNFPVVVPPLAEQQAIVDHLDRETAKIDALTAKITESIDLLEEYRAALISAAVTGKIDVRDHPAATPTPPPSTKQTP